MPRHTPPRSPDLGLRYPRIAATARVAVRLHPQRTSMPLPVTASKIGGRIAWPIADPWPVCRDHEYAMEVRSIHSRQLVTVGPDDPRHTGIVLPVLQLRRADVPELPFPGDTDLFQMLWCSRLHDDDVQPRISLRWRRETDLGSLRSVFPAPMSDAAHLGPGLDDLLIPRYECFVQPDRVIDYLSPVELEEMESLDQDVLTDVWRVNNEGGVLAYPGTKVGGYPAWDQGPVQMTCPQGHPMCYLMTFGSDEPLDQMVSSPEEQEALKQGHADTQALTEPTGMTFGRFGSMFVFYCPVCADHPAACDTQ